MSPVTTPLTAPLSWYSTSACSETGKDLHAEGFRLLTEPAADAGQADHIVAVIAEAGGSIQFGTLNETAFGEKKEPVLAYRGVERGVPFLPVREQFRNGARVHYRAREDVRADFGAFLDYAHRDLLPRSVLNFLSRIAAASPAGPAPTITTSYCMDSRSAKTFLLAENEAVNRRLLE